MYNNQHVFKRYSESFKLKILSKFGDGKHSKRQLCKIYGIPSGTVNEWIKKYNPKDLMSKRIMIEDSEELGRIKELQKENKKLKKLLLKKDLEEFMNQLLF